MITKTAPSIASTLAVLVLGLALVPTTGMADRAIESRLEKARQAINEREYKTAVIQLKNVLQREPSNLQARLRLSQVYLNLGLGAEAEKELTQAERLGLGRSLVLAPLSKAMLQQAAFERLTEISAAGVALAAEDKAALLARQAIAMEALKRPLEADALLSDAQSLAADSRVVLLSDARIKRARNRIDPALRIASLLLLRDSDDVDALLLQAELLITQGKGAEAVRDLERLVGLAPWNRSARVKYITAIIGIGDLDRAEEEIKKAAEPLKNVPYLDFLKGLVSFHRDQSDAARGAFERTLAKLPDYAPAHLYLGALAYREQQYETAEGHIRTYVDEFPQDSSSARLLSATLMRLQRPEEAAALLGPLVKKDPNNPQALALYGSAQMQMGNQVRGVELIDRAVKLAPDAAALRAQLALGYLFGGNDKQAEAALRDAVDLGGDLVQADVMLVLLALKRRDMPAALTAAREMGERRPDSALAPNLEGAAHLLAGDYGAARQAYQKALDIDPDFHTARLNLARVDIAENKLEAAEARLRKLLRVAPDEVGSYLALAEIAKRRDDEPTAIDWLERAMARNPANLQPGLRLLSYYQDQDSTLKALRVARQMLNANPTSSVAMRSMGLAQFRNGDHASAAASFQKLVQTVPTSANARYLLGVAQRDSGNARAAIQSLEQGWRLDSSKTNIGIALANLYNDAERYDDALQIAKKLQTNDQFSWAGYQLESNTYARAGEDEKALAALEKTVQLRPTSSLVILLAQSRYRAGNVDSAEQVLREWLAKQEKDLAAQTALATLLHQSGKRAAAIEAYEAVVHIEPDHIMALNNLAWLYHEAGDDRSLSTARKALSLAPDRAEIADTLGWVLVQNKQYSEGLVHLREAGLRMPENLDIQYHIAEALVGVGRPDEAIETLDKILPKGEAVSFPSAKEARELLKRLNAGRG